MSRLHARGFYAMRRACRLQSTNRLPPAAGQIQRKVGQAARLPLLRRCGRVRPVSKRSSLSKKQRYVPRAASIPTFRAQRGRGYPAVIRGYVRPAGRTVPKAPPNRRWSHRRCRGIQRLETSAPPRFAGIPLNMPACCSVVNRDDDRQQRPPHFTAPFCFLLPPYYASCRRCDTARLVSRLNSRKRRGFHTARRFVRLS